MYKLAILQNLSTNWLYVGIQGEEVATCMGVDIHDCNRSGISTAECDNSFRVAAELDNGNDMKRMPQNATYAVKEIRCWACDKLGHRLGECCNKAK